MPSRDKGGESDAGLMALVREGDMEALGDLYEKYGGFVDNAILSAAPRLSRSEVEDLCQDVFLAIRKCASKYKEEGRFKSWMYSLAVRTTRERQRKWAIRSRILGMLKGPPLAVSGMDQTAPDVGAMMRMDTGRILEQLPEMQRQVLVLYERDGLKGQEIAELLGLNLNTVWTHLRRAREELNALMRREDKGGGEK